MLPKRNSKELSSSLFKKIILMGWRKWNLYQLYRESEAAVVAEEVEEAEVEEEAVAEEVAVVALSVPNNKA